MTKLISERMNMAIYSNEDLIKYYEDALLNRKNDITRQYAEAEQLLRASKPNIEDAYAKARTNAYTTARLSAIGNNERLAASGLAGNLYAQPRTGYSETSRIYQDVAMQNTINALGEEQRKALQELEAAIRSNQQNKLSALNTVESQYGEQIANLRQSALDKNFQLEKSQADTLASMASQGYELDDAQKALLAKYNYNYDAIRKQYLDTYNKSIVEEYKKWLAQGGTLTPEQAELFNQYSPITLDQYNQYLTTQRDAAFAEEFNAGDIDIEGLKKYKGKISDDLYNSALAALQAQKAQEFATRFDSDVRGDDKSKREQYFIELDNAVDAGQITAEQRAEFYKHYYDNVISTVYDKSDYDKTLADIEDDREKLGAYYEEVKAALESKKPTVQEVEKGKKAMEDTTSGIAAALVGGTAVPLESGWLAEGFQQIQDNISKKKADLKTYAAPSGVKYSVVDKSSKYGINSASLTLGEWVTVNYENGQSDDLYISVYASSKITKEMDSKGIKTGQIYKASNGNYYLRGKNKDFKVTNVNTALFGS